MTQGGVTPTEGAPDAQKEPAAPTGPLQIRVTGERWVVIDQRNNRVLLTRPLVNMLGDLETLNRLDRMRTRTILTRTTLLSAGAVLVVGSMVNLGASGAGEPDSTDFIVDCGSFRNQSRCEQQQQQQDQLFDTALSSFRSHRSWTSLVLLGTGSLCLAAVPFASWEYRDASYTPREVYDQQQLQRLLNDYNQRVMGSAELQVGPGWVAIHGTLP